MATVTRVGSSIPGSRLGPLRLTVATAVPLKVSASPVTSCTSAFKSPSSMASPVCQAAHRDIGGGGTGVRKVNGRDVDGERIGGAGREKRVAGRDGYRVARR